MPTKRRNLNRAFRPEAFDPLDREFLLTGHHWDEEPSKAKQRELWETYADELIEFWISDPDKWFRAGNQNTFGAPPPAGLFRRPFGWWKFGQHVRQRVRGDRGQWDDDERWFGAPRFGMDQSDFETEREYLIRNPQMLLPAERDALKAEKL
jgi:hypothetical protein